MEGEELTLKTAYIFNFTKFIQWPTDTKEISICAPSHHEIAKPLKTLETQKANNKDIRVKLYDSLRDVEQCNIVYLSNISDSLYKEIISFTKDKPIVTITRQDEYADDQSIIQFYIKKFSDNRGRLRFSIDLERAKAANISVSSNLIKFATRK